MNDCCTTWCGRHRSSCHSLRRMQFLEESKQKTNLFWGNFQLFTCQAELLGGSGSTAANSWRSQRQTKSCFAKARDNSPSTITHSKPVLSTTRSFACTYACDWFQFSTWNKYENIKKKTTCLQPEKSCQTEHGFRRKGESSNSKRSPLTTTYFSSLVSWKQSQQYGCSVLPERYADIIQHLSEFYAASRRVLIMCSVSSICFQSLSLVISLFTWAPNQVNALWSACSCWINVYLNKPFWSPGWLQSAFWLCKLQMLPYTSPVLISLLSSEDFISSVTMFFCFIFLHISGKCCSC